ncbi:hypothetical protein GLYMA_02G011550v4 [Glycine max]|nr:hypothetical protein GLYMA_02G011550v4 [Glycine max]KAH1058217.1 hypothetical protein GYH30_002668 [Glycine max]
MLSMPLVASMFLLEAFCILSLSHKVIKTKHERKEKKFLIRRTKYTLEYKSNSSEHNYNSRSYHELYSFDVFGQIHPYFPP